MYNQDEENTKNFSWENKSVQWGSGQADLGGESNPNPNLGGERNLTLTLTSTENLT